MILFLDTSALVKLYVVEDGSETTHQAAQQADILAVSRIAWAEFHAVLVVLQPDNLGFSVPVALRCKARRAGNGRSPCQAAERGSGVPQERPKGWSVSVHGGVPALAKGYGHSLRAAPCPER